MPSKAYYSSPLRHASSANATQCLVNRELCSVAEGNRYCLSPSCINAWALSSPILSDSLVVFSCACAPQYSVQYPKFLELSFFAALAFFSTLSYKV